MPRFLSNLFSSCCWIESRSLGTKLHGSFHLFVAAGTEFWVDRPGSQDQGAPLDPFARLGFFSRFLSLAFLFRIQVAQGVDEVASIGHLVLAGARDVLHPDQPEDASVLQKVIGVLPHLGDGPRRREPDLAGGLHIGQMLQWQGWPQDVIQHSLQARAVGRLADGVAHKGRESRAVQRPGFQEFRGFGLPGT